nr:MAG TPA: SERINE, ALANINE, ASPARTIC ACID, pore formation, beta sandwich [Caudoviricetes sp.]
MVLLPRQGIVVGGVPYNYSLFNNYLGLSLLNSH